MAKPAYEQYTEEVHHELGKLGTWLPSARVRLGDVGVMQGREFERNSTLADLDVAFMPAADDISSTFGFVSDGAVEVIASAKAEAGVFGGTGTATGISAQMSFTRANAVFFRVEGAVVHRIDDLDAVKEAVLALDSRGKWRREWLVVTQVVVAQRCLVMVSGSEGARAEVAVRVGVLPSAAEIASGGAQVAGGIRQGMAFDDDIVGECTPLYQAFRVARGVVRQSRPQRVGPEGRLLPGADAGEDYTDFVPYAYDDGGGSES
ncbi:MAG: hypothetical protein QOH12_3029 [Solirubrobacteraceae bacterium]|jgi:hypothetical protein|nr:hypothetical protein [Solirubrobacteraceae bacterium]